MRALASCSTPVVIAMFLMGCWLPPAGLSAQMPNGWKAHDLKRPAPTVVTPAEKVGNAPGDAVVLFDGTDLSQWQSSGGSEAKWKIVDGAMESVAGSGYVFTKEKFGDCQLHVEFASPATVKGNGQGRGNSGVFLMGDFEVQVLDSFENPTYADGSAGSIYGQHAPLVNASRGPGQWQSYDIIFRRPRFDESGKLLKPARVTVLHNGVVVQDASEPFGPTTWIRHNEYDPNKTEGPLSLQDHGNPVRYRNIWIRRLAETTPLPAQPYDPEAVEIADDDAAKLVGKFGPHRIAVEEGKLYFYFHSARMQMVPLSATEFSFKRSAGKLTLTLDEAGSPSEIELQLDAAGKQRHARKAE